MKSKIRNKTLALAIAIVASTGAMAQFAQEAKIVSNNRESRAEYGTAVDLHASFAVVGASRETIASGAAYVYEKDGQGNWSLAQRLAAADPNQGAEYGGGVKFSTDFLVVAAGRADIGNAQRAGALYVYNYSNNNWDFNTKLVASDLTSEAKLGMNPTSLDVEGNTIVAGAPGENVWTGSVYVFKREAGMWIEAQKIFSPTPQTSDVFGVGVALSGDYLVVGANEVDGRKGAAYIYLKNGNGQFEYVQTVMASDASNDSFFGTAVSISGDQMVIGAYGATAEQGAAYIFERNAQGIWTEVQKITGNSSSESTHFGWCTDMQQNHIVVSAPHLFGMEEGEVYFYKRNGSGTWMEDQMIQGNDTAGEDFFGWSVAIHQDGIIVGAPWEDHDANGGNEIDRAGSAYIFNDPSILGTEQHAIVENLRLYPNPSRNFISLESKDKTIQNIQLFGMGGAQLMEKTAINQQSFRLDISALAEGIYFVNIIFADGSRSTEKVMKL
ncbi:T9SS type A sorting domain-containing protein [Aequorivita sp. SDUM287046]|uniref:T9SS type A sorting domain-containing protein n=1 Tax=Aequorivita aurantiaca TaxID=3053356 RepID=A0ABT8DJD4_9FLAO|nr:T9SS type A sorting domain-containing protein [Aequorivita aurantiaca]MDN3725492.1 T9SS type A sorting domain-containing protein [Aequorivita aurantiaca]